MHRVEMARESERRSAKSWSAAAEVSQVRGARSSFCALHVRTKRSSKARGLQVTRWIWGRKGRGSFLVARQRAMLSAVTCSWLQSSCSFAAWLRESCNFCRLAAL
eukprot:4361495-Pleurochrysis_carterae.AAC.2